MVADADLVDPAEVTRRSFVRRALAAAGASFTALGDSAVAARVPGGGAVDGLALCDLSGLPRIGIKGRDALAWLRAQGFSCGDVANRTYRQADGTLLAVLAANEAVLLSPLATPTQGLFDLAARCSLDDGVRRYPVARADANFEFIVTGTAAAEMLAKVCAVDLRAGAFGADGVAQTSVARSNAIVIRDDLGAVPAYRLLGDSASAAYMWASLLDAMAEFGGGPAGLADILDILPADG